ncbi:unnamed protein product [Miscanthus lutarioriparius]|uniref:Uncharacterized protein n=1 Tax=Miscanthus lutarioriparius TaxID=422564 RepID=A0A811MU29_9POAL|nr:unnamed protein product [Miscanthus lutarioriparius]
MQESTAPSSVQYLSQTELGAVLSCIDHYSLSISSAAYLLAGMADLGHLPVPVRRTRPVFDTPRVSITVTGAIALGMSFLSFDSIVVVTNFLYSLGMLLEFAAFVWLRAKRPDMPRPYRVPSAFLVLVMAVAGWKLASNYAVSVSNFSMEAREGTATATDLLKVHIEMVILGWSYDVVSNEVLDKGSDQVFCYLLAI